MRSQSTLATWVPNAAKGYPPHVGDGDALAKFPARGRAWSSMLATPHRAPSHWCGTFLSSACPYHDEGRRYSCHLAHAAQAAHNASPYAKCLPIERLCRRCKHGSTVRLCTGNATDLLYEHSSAQAPTRARRSPIEL